MITLIKSMAHQAITTKYLPRTDTKVERAKATTASGLSVTANWDYGLSPEQNHSAVAMYLVEQLDWDGQWAMGATKDGYVFVNVVKD